MKPSVAQHRYLNGILLPLALTKMHIEPTKEIVLGMKEIMKRYLGVYSTAMLTDIEFNKFVNKVCMLLAREYSVYIPLKSHEPDNSVDLDLDDYLKIIGYYDN